MRLTLRNLLRFLDQTNLGPLERDRLQELVEHSDRAEAWIERIRSLRADPGKAAPRITGPPAPCRVAQYLDGSLSEQETIEFEEAMLASDEILAEVASAHRIVQQLSTAQPPGIPIVLRQTLYDLDRVFGDSGGSDAGPADGEHAGGHGAVTSMEDLPFEDASEPDASSDAMATELEDVGDEDSNHQPPVSLDRLTRRARDRSLVLAGLVITVLAGILGVTYWLGRESARLSQPARVPNARAPVDALPRDIDDGEGPVADERAAAGRPDPDSPPTGDQADVEQPAGDADQPPEPQGPGATLLVDQPPPPAPEVAAPGQPDPPVPPRPDLSVPDLPVPEVPVVDAEAFIGPIQPPRVVARSTEPQVLALMRAPNAEDWTVLTDAADLREGDHVKVLGGMAAEFELGQQLKLRAVGPAEFSLGQRDRASQADLIDLEFGTVVVESRESDVDWILQLGDDRYAVTMLLAAARVEAQAIPYLPPGIDPRHMAPAVVRTFQALEGRCRIQKNEFRWNLATGHALLEVDSAIPEIAQAAQTGVVQQPIARPRFVERLTDVVEDNLRAWRLELRSVPDELLDMKSDSRQEIRLAAMAWLAEQGNFDFVVDFLSNPSNKSNWRTFIEAVQHTLRNRPESATRLFDGLGFAGAENQEKLYGLILGFAPPDLEAGLDARLVDYLNDANLAVRVLAIENFAKLPEE